MDTLTIYFKLYDSRDGILIEYSEPITVSGVANGTTLADVISLSGLTFPETVKAAYNTYTFKGWNVDPDTYIIGSEVDSTGGILHTLIFYAQYDEKATEYVYTFNSGEGKFADGSTQKTITAEIGSTVDMTGYFPEDFTKNGKTYSFSHWLSPEGAMLTLSGNSFDASIFKEFTAQYFATDATITVTISGKATLEDGDTGSGVIYFDGETTKTYNLKANQPHYIFHDINDPLFSVDSVYGTYIPTHVLCTTESGKQTVYTFDEYERAYSTLYSLTLLLQESATLELCVEYAGLRQADITYVGEGYAYDESGNQLFVEGTTDEPLVIEGYMTFLTTWRTDKVNIGAEIELRSPAFFDERYVFAYWTDANGTQYPAGSKITVTEGLHLTASYIFVNDIQIKFYATSTDHSNNNMSIHTTESVIVGLPIFPDGLDCKTVGIKGGNSVKVPSEPIVEGGGYVFAGWIAGGAEMDSDTGLWKANQTILTTAEIEAMTFDSSTSYFAVFKPDGTYTVTLNSGSGSFDDGSTVKTEAVIHGTLASDLSKPKKAPAGYVFSHYEDAEGRIVTVIGEDVELTAVFAKPISTYEEFLAINDALNENYVLTANIAAPEEIIYSWTPIGEGTENGFTGTFNGNGYGIIMTAEISGYTKSEHFGLFGLVSGKIFNFSCAASFALSGKTSAIHIGSLAGELSETGMIIDCYIGGLVATRITTNRGINAGGVIGTNRGTVDGLLIYPVVYLMENGILVEGTSKTVYAGSICGANYGTIANANLNSGISFLLNGATNAYIGSFAGYNAGTISNSRAASGVWLSVHNGDNAYAANVAKYGNIVGLNEGDVNNCMIENKDTTGSFTTTMKYKGDEVLVYYTNDEYSHYIYISYEGGSGITVNFKDDTGDHYDDYYSYTVWMADTENQKFFEKVQSLTNLYDIADVHGNALGENCIIPSNQTLENVYACMVDCGLDGLRFVYLERLFDSLRSAN